MRGAARRTLDFLRSSGGALDERNMNEAERAFVRAVRAELSSAAFRFEGSANLEVVPVARGRLPCRVRRDRGLVYVPLRTRAARRLIRALWRDPRRLYMVMAVLFGGVDGYAARKGRWQSAWLAPT